MFGGEVIGQGTYGCAVNPPFLCRGQARNERLEKKKKVGKITVAADAKTEIDIAKTLRKIKLWKNYFILVDVDQCSPVEAERSSNWEACKITSEYKKKNLLQVTSDFGGISFSSISNTNLKPGKFDYFHFMKHILEAGALLALHGVVHYDLHRANILVDAAGVPRLLDFGMAFEASQIDKDILDNRWKVYDPGYDSEPPEVTIITGTRKDMPLEVLLNECINQKPVLREVELVLGISMESQFRRLFEFLMTSKSYKKGDWVTFYKTYWPVFDSFALGAILLHVLKIQLTWPDFVESPEWEEKGETVYNILTNMLKVSPSDRFDCVEALFLLDPKSVVLKGSEGWLSARKKEREE